MSNEDLALCPFCGMEPATQELDNFYTIWCGNDECAPTVETFHSIKQKAIDQWNRRAPDAALRSMAGQELDFPDGPGWWAFEGHMYWSPSRELKATIYVSDIGGDELSPSVMMRDKTTHDIVAEQYRSHTVFVGKWTRVYMPWERRVPAGEATEQPHDGQ